MWPRVSNGGREGEILHDNKSTCILKREIVTYILSIVIHCDSDMLVSLAAAAMRIK